MKYYVVNIQIKDSTSAQSIFEYATKEDAETAYHSTLASNYTGVKDSNLDSFSVVLLNQYGTMEDNECYDPHMYE